MTSLKTFLLKTLGGVGALILAPVVALFGLMTLGLAIGLSLMIAVIVVVMAKRAEHARATQGPATAAQPAV